MKILKAAFKIILGTISALFCAFMILWLVIIPIGNNVILNNYAKELKTYDIGSDYEIVESISACGKLYGNGNGMEYMVMMLVKSEEELEETPPSLGDGIWVIRADNAERLEYILASSNQYEVASINEKIVALENLDEYYIVHALYSADSDSIWTMDLRAH